MARKGDMAGQEKQGSLFGDALPSTAPKKGRGRQKRKTSTPTINVQPEPPPSVAAPPEAGQLRRTWKAFGDWILKVLAEAFHKEAVKGVRIFIWIMGAGILFGFFTFLKIDVSARLAPLWSYIDAIETQVLAKGRPAKGSAPISTGGIKQEPGADADQQKKSVPRPEGWTVDVFPERD